MYSAMTPCLSSRSRAGEGSSFLGALSFGSIIPIGARQMGTFDLCQGITSARNDRAVPPGRDQSALIILLVQIQPSAQPGRGPLASPAPASPAAAVPAVASPDRAAERRTAMFLDRGVADSRSRTLV